MFVRIQRKKTGLGRFFYQANCLFYMAEREGFEPPDLLQSTVFKTAALNRSATSPKVMAGVTTKRKDNRD